MAGYNDTRNLIIEALMGRQVGTEIQPEKHQAYALNMLDYVRSVELVSSSTLVGLAEESTVPVQPDQGKVCYIAGVGQDRTVTFSNFIDDEGNPISITTGEMEGVFVILLWNMEHWVAYTFNTNIISSAESANFYYGYNIRKTYASVAAMNADSVNPIGTDGRLIKIGELVTVVNSTTPAENGYYSYEGSENGWLLQSGFSFEVVQTTGTDINKTMSQKAVTDELALKADQTELDQLADDVNILETIQSNIKYPTARGTLASNGTFTANESSDIEVTDFIRVREGQILKISAFRSIGFHTVIYNVTKSSRRNTLSSQLLIEPGDHYVRISNDTTLNPNGISVETVGITESFIDADAALKTLMNPATYTQKLKNITWVVGRLNRVTGVLETVDLGSFRTTEHFNVIPGEVITTNGYDTVKGLTRIVFYNKDGDYIGVTQETIIEVPENAATCRMSIYKNIQPPEDVYIISDLSKVVTKEATVTKDEVINSIFLPDAFHNANYSEARNNAEFYHKVFKKIALHNFNASSKFYLATFRVEVNEEGVPTFFIRLNDETYGRTFGLRMGVMEGINTVSDLIGIKRIWINAWGYFRTAGITSMVRHPNFYVGYVDIDLSVLKQILEESVSVNYGDGAGWSAPNYAMTGILNCEKIDACKNVSEMLVVNADETHIGGTYFSKKKKGKYVDVDYSMLSKFDVSKHYNISSANKIINQPPKRIEDIDFRTTENASLYLQGIVDNQFYFLDINGNVYKADYENDDQVSDDNIIFLNSEIPNTISYLEHKICNVVPLKHGGMILQVYGTEDLLDGNKRVCADNYLFKNGVVKLAFRKPSTIIPINTVPKNIIDYRADRYSDNGDVIVISDYGDRTLTGTLHMSWDSGETWKNIFRMKLSDESPDEIVNPALNWANETETTRGNHIHATHYDRWRDCVYVVTGDVGDYGIADGVESSIYYCFNYKDEIPTWQQKSLKTNLLYGRNTRQYLGIQSFENCVIFGTDNGFDVGYDRINDGDDNMNIDYAYVSYSRTEGSGIKHIVANMFKNDYDSPALGLLADYESNPDAVAAGNYPSQMVSSFDGYKFQKLYTFNAGEIARMAIICQSDKYMYVRNRGISFTGKWIDKLNDTEIAKCFVIKMTIPK